MTKRRRRQYHSHVPRAPRLPVDTAITVYPDPVPSAPVPSDRVVAEIIGRVTDFFSYNSLNYTTTYDKHRADYEFWDRLRSGQAVGYELGGIYCQPVYDIKASYVIGDLPTYLISDSDVPDSRREYTNREIAKQLHRYHGDLMKMESDKYALGDQFIVVNPNGDFAFPTPDMVDMEFDPFESGRVSKATVRISGNGRSEVWTYTPETITVKQTGRRGETRVFENLIGEVPVVPFAHNRRSNEIYGRPDLEACLPYLMEHHDLLEKTFDGVKLMGNPIPTFTGVDDLTNTIAANDTNTAQTYYDDDGVPTTRQLLAFDRNGAVLAGKGGDFKFVHPSIGFTEDSVRIIDKIFDIILKHARVPEVVWGGARTGDRAAAEVQMPPFVRYIGALRTELDGTEVRGMKALLRIWLKTKRLTDRKIAVASLRSQWKSVALENEQIKFQKTIYADGKAMIRGATALDLLELVPDPADEFARAQEEREDEMDDYGTMLNTAARQQMDERKNVPSPAVPPTRDAAQQNPAGGARIGDDADED